MTTSELTWSEVGGGELDVATLYDVLALRSAVFVVEQECAYQDIDGLDLEAGTRHVVGREDGAIAAYARILAPGRRAPDAPHRPGDRERVGEGPAARPRADGAGAGELCRALAGRGVELGAQAHLTGFYASLGFETVGEPYDEDGIPHVWMRRPRP